MSDNVVELQGFSKFYGTFPAVKDLSLTIPHGSVFGFLGPNGAGKTTTIRVLCGYLKPTAGSARIFGRSPGHPSLRHGRLAALPQDAVLPGHYTVSGFLRYMGELQHFSPARARQEARRVLELVGLSDNAERPICSLSHGMARRVSLAQAFLGTPGLILLDEPTSGLDPRHAHQIRELIDKLRGTSTLLLASHNLAEVQELCDHVAIIDKGQLVAAGSTDEICRTTQSLLIELSAERVDAVALSKASGMDCSWDAAKQTLLVDVQASSGRGIDQVTTDVLRWVLDKGHGIRALRRGESLEKRYLELT